MGLGASRADITVINGLMHGYELKSKSDNLLRLPQQVKYYSSIMDKTTLVVSECHAKQAMGIIPDWWGVKIAVEGARSGISLQTERRNRLNPSVDKIALSMLLWKDEMLSILSELGEDRGLKSKPRRILWTKLADLLETDDLRNLVRAKLKARINWKVDPLPS